MRKQKRKFNRMLHPNRHFIWALVLLVLSGAVLAAYIYIAAVQTDSEAIFPNLVSRKVFIDNAAKYAVKYPASWQLEKDQQGNIVFEDPALATENITIAQADPKFEKIIRASLRIRNEYDYAAKGYDYNVITAVNNNQGLDINVALVKGAGKMYYISGHSRNFMIFVRNFRPL